MSSRALVFVATIAALLVCACSAQPPVPPPEVPLQPDVTAPLPPLPALGHPWRANQLLTISARGQQDQVPVQLELTADTLTMVALSPWGSRLLTVHYDGLHIQVEAEPGAAALPPPSHIVADVLLVNWPVHGWALPPGWRLEQTAQSRRLLDAAGKLVTEVQYPSAEGQAIELNNPIFGYRLTIRTLDGDPPVR